MPLLIGIFSFVFFRCLQQPVGINRQLFLFFRLKIHAEMQMRRKLPFCSLFSISAVTEKSQEFSRLNSVSFLSFTGVGIQMSIVIVQPSCLADANPIPAKRQPAHLFYSSL